MMTAFAHLGLSDDLLRAIEDKGYTAPSPIQERAIPAILEGRDVMAAAQTGTGKTAGFTLPLLQLLRPGKSAASNRCRALVLTPTRELAAQVGESVATYGQHMGLRSTVVYGGVKINPQMMALRKGADVLIATPGRLMDLHQQNAVNFNDVEILVLDEADRMLDMGFIHDIKKILALLPAKRQNLLFSATFSDDIRQLAMGILHEPIEINISPKNSTAETVDQWIHPVDKTRKAELLSHLITSRDWRQALVFTRTKHGANKLAAFLNKEEIRSSAIHGNKSQAARLKALEDFKRGRVNILVATDIAARGLDIVELPQVVNFDLPNVPEDYVHRIGRTGRAGSKGRAISLVSADEFHQLWDIEKLIDRKLTRDTIKGFEPEHAVPESKGLKGAPAVSKPKVKAPARTPRPARAKPQSASPAVKLERADTKSDTATNVDGQAPLRKSLSRNLPPPSTQAAAETTPVRREHTPRADQPRPQHSRGDRGDNTQPRGDNNNQSRPYPVRSEQPRGGYTQPNNAQPKGDQPKGDNSHNKPRDERTQSRGDHNTFKGNPKKPQHKHYEGKPKAFENGDKKPHGGEPSPRTWQDKPYSGSKPAHAGAKPAHKTHAGKPTHGGKPTHTGKKPGQRPAYVGVYQRPAEGDYRTEAKLQSFGNRADIPADKLKALDEKPQQKRHYNNAPRSAHSNGGGSRSNGGGGYSNGQQQPYSGGYKGKSASNGYQGAKKPYSNNNNAAKPIYTSGSGSYVSPGSAPTGSKTDTHHGGGYKGKSFKKPFSGDEI
ncbi:MAG: hypothetical protein RL497_2712 [Pseudomonadota bacterium]